MRHFLIEKMPIIKSDERLKKLIIENVITLIIIHFQNMKLLTLSLEICLK